MASPNMRMCGLAHRDARSWTRKELISLDRCLRPSIREKGAPSFSWAIPTICWLFRRFYCHSLDHFSRGTPLALLKDVRRTKKRPLRKGGPHDYCYQTSAAIDGSRPDDGS